MRAARREASQGICRNARAATLVYRLRRNWSRNKGYVDRRAGRGCAPAGEVRISNKSTGCGAARVDRDRTARASASPSSTLPSRARQIGEGQDNDRLTSLARCCAGVQEAGICANGIPHLDFNRAIGQVAKRAGTAFEACRLSVALEAHDIIGGKIMVSLGAAKCPATVQVIQNLELHAVGDGSFCIDKEIELSCAAAESAADSLDEVNQRIVRCAVESSAVVCGDEIGRRATAARQGQ